MPKSTKDNTSEEIEKKKKKKKNTEEGAEEEAPKKKKQKKEKKAEPEPEQEPESDNNEEEGEANDDEKKKNRRSMASRKSKKTRGLRMKAAEAGYAKNTIGAGAGVDHLHTLITTHDARRMMTFMPKRIKEAGAYHEEEHELRLKNSEEKFSAQAVKLVAMKAETIFRNVMNEAMARAVEQGKSGIDTTIMASVLRPYATKMMFNSRNAPIGLVHHAAEEGVFNLTEADEENAVGLKKMFSTQQKQVDAVLASNEAEKQARRDKFNKRGTNALKKQKTVA